MDYLLIDGYNIINAWKDIFNFEKDTLEEARDKLLNILSNYQGYTRTNVIAVFDAHMVKGSREKEEAFDNIKIVFTKENETADNYIEKFVHRYGSIHTVRVVTSDYLEQTIVLSNGGIRMSPRDLKEEIDAAGKGSKVEIKKDNGKMNTLFSRVKPELLEKLEKFRRGK